MRVKTDYSNVKLPIEKWNATTFRAYLKRLNIEKFGVPQSGLIQSENMIIKTLVNDYGKETVKKLAEYAVKEYKPYGIYNSVNWYYINYFMIGNLLYKIRKDDEYKKEIELLNGEKVKEFNNNDETSRLKELF